MSRKQSPRASPLNVLTRELVPSRCEDATYESGIIISDELLSTLNFKNKDALLGIGLAAPQVGKNTRVFVMLTVDEGVTYFRRFINPAISNLREPISFGGEGCLSFPNEVCATIRYAKCTITDMMHDELELEGMDAICAQHEVDHLDGRTMYDRRATLMEPNKPCLCGSQRKWKKCCAPAVKPWIRKEKTDV